MVIVKQLAYGCRDTLTFWFTRAGGWRTGGAGRACPGHIRGGARFASENEGAICGRWASCSMKHVADGCRLKAEPGSKSARRSFVKLPNRSARRCRPVSGRSSSAAWQRSPFRDISARGKCKRLWRPSSPRQSSPVIPLPNPRSGGRPPCTMSGIFMSGEATPCCSWERQKGQSTAKERVIVPLTFYIRGPLREFTGGCGKIENAQHPATLADALRLLWDLHPGVRDRISTEQGQIREHINIFIGSEEIRYTGGLASPLPADSEVWIVRSITGG